MTAPHTSLRQGTKTTPKLQGHSTMRPHKIRAVSQEWELRLHSSSAKMSSYRLRRTRLPPSSDDGGTHLSEQNWGNDQSDSLAWPRSAALWEMHKTVISSGSPVKCQSSISPWKLNLFVPSSLYGHIYQSPFLLLIVSLISRMAWVAKPHPWEYLNIELPPPPGKFQ